MVNCTRGNDSQRERLRSYTPITHATLRALDGLSRAKTSTDYTAYGTARSSPHRFYAHHSAAISAAIVFADARTIDAAAAHMSWLVSVGVTP